MQNVLEVGELGVQRAETLRSQVMLFCPVWATIVVAHNTSKLGEDVVFWTQLLGGEMLLD